MLVLKNPEIKGDKCEEGYAIDADDFNIILYRLNIAKGGKKAGEIYRTAMAYCTSLEQVLKRIYQLEVSSQGLTSLSALEDRIQATIDTCVKSLGDFNKVRGELKCGQ